MKDNDYVVLVNDQNKVLNTSPKLATHNNKTPLHRGFSVFLFNLQGKLLLQQRSRTKKTFPLVWSNSVCGHPKLDESTVQAAKRKLLQEMGIGNVEVFEIISDYKYKVCMNDICENEICPVAICFTDQQPKPNKDEVENFKWIDWEKFVKDIKNNPGKYSLWSEQETKLLEQNKKFQELYKKFTK